jgi:RimJ/RimL family protein N-acetyltransferase
VKGARGSVMPRRLIASGVRSYFAPLEKRQRPKCPWRAPSARITSTFPNESSIPAPDPDLTDGRVALRRWALSDLPALRTAGADPMIQRFRYSVPTTEPDALQWLDELEPDRQAGHRLELAIAAVLNDHAIGSISLTDLEHHNAMIRYWLLPDARGHGIASAAVRLLAGWAIDALQIARLALHVEPDNGSSVRLAERCGFVFEGRLRSHFETKDGRRSDLLMYGLLPGELR